MHHMATPRPIKQANPNDNEDTRPMCIYRELCGRSDVNHWERFQHPKMLDTPQIRVLNTRMPLRALGVNAFTQNPDGTLSMTWKDTRPACINGASCQRYDIHHWIDYHHPDQNQ